MSACGVCSCECRCLGKPEMSDAPGARVVGSGEPRGVDAGN